MPRTKQKQYNAILHCGAIVIAFSVPKLFIRIAKKEKMSDKKYIHQENWSKKHGYKSISFKLKESTVQEFKDTCKRLGVSQGATLTEFMEAFIKNNKDNS